MNAVANYFRVLTASFVAGWNRFWFTPADPYPLGVIRLGTGLVACWLQICLMPEVVRFFAAGGWLPVDVVKQTSSFGYRFSYLDYIDSPSSLLTAQWIGLVVVVAFTVGLWTRLTSVLALLVMLSSIHRAPMIATQVEPIVTMVMFYLCLGPAGASCSLDRILARRASGGAGAPGAAEPVLSVGANLSLRLIQVHLAMIYFTLGTAKLLGPDSVWWAGLGTWWLASRPESRLADLTHLPRYAFDFWTHAIVACELTFPVLVWNRVARPLMLAIAALIWLSVALLTGQVEYALMMIVANLSFASGDWLRGCCRSKAGEPSLAAAG